MSELRRNMLEKAGFKCQKCGFYSPNGKDLDISGGDTVLCSICLTFAPDIKAQLEKYIAEKIDWQVLDTFRKYNVNRSSHSANKRSMIEKSKQGKIMSRPAFGYKIKDGNLIPDDENRDNVKLIFEEFAAGKSLNRISQTYGISVNGIKKILHNFTYIGKVKFNSQISQGNHLSIISPELFNSVQKMFESKKKTSG